MTDPTHSQTDYLLELLAHPELEQTETFIHWIKDPANRQLYLDAKAAYDSLALQELPLPNTQDEWERIHKHQKTHVTRHIHHPKRVRHMWYIAASFIILVSLGGLIYRQYNQIIPDTPIALVEMQTSPQEVTLQTTEGNTLVLSPQTSKDSLTRLGMKLENEQKLAYAANSTAQTDMHLLTTPRGKDFKIVLNDGTEVWLNAESTLRYPSRFTGAQRIVELSGEAYFQVASDPEHPFIVKSADIETKVLGTSFNLRNYTHNTPHVTLVEGKLLVNVNQTSAILKPGEDALIDKDGQIRIQQVDTRNYTAWTNGFFYFENNPLSDIMYELGRWYNLTILFQNPKAMNYHFNFWAKRNAPIEEVLALINAIGKVTITVKENVLTIE